MQRSLYITVQSAIATLQILDRQARRDCGKVARFSHRVYRGFSSPQAVQTYRCIWAVLQLLALVAIALGVSAREWCDRLVESSLESPDEAATPAPSAEVETVPPAPAPQFSDAVVPFKRPNRHPAWDCMPSQQLRKECQQRQIAWRNAHGKGRHLSKPEMVQALQTA